MGIGVVIEADNRQVKVHFLRLSEARSYTTRTQEHAVLRYEIGPGERVGDLSAVIDADEDDAAALLSTAAGTDTRVKRRLPLKGNRLWVYELESGEQVYESQLRPHVRDVGPKERLASLHLVHPETVRARIQGLALSQFGSRPGESAILGGRAQWLPHQIDVATRAVGQEPVRMLLADEVGLGKTVEAALIYAGLKSEGRAERVLILTPEPLCIQWLQEIYRKAHDLMVLFDTARIEDAQSDFGGLNPFDAHQRMVMSTERLAADPELAAYAMAADWDLVIVDEAHHLRWRPKSGGNKAYKLVEGLARQSRHVLLLTATPMALDPTEYHALLRLLDPERFDDPKAFDSVAARARDLRDAARLVAEADTAELALEPATRASVEELLSDDAEDVAAFKRFCSLSPKTAARREALAPVLEALRQRHGLTDYVVRNRRGPVGGMPERRPQVVGLVPSDAQDMLLKMGEGIMLDLAQTMPDAPSQARALGELLRALWATPRALLDILQPYSPQLAKEIAPYVQAVVGAPVDAAGLPTGDTRLRWLVEQVRALPQGDKLLVFVESAIAVKALKETLEPVLGSEIAMFHRELSPRDQDRQVAYFRSADGPNIMLSTEAGGEGRNFQFCHQVILYDLPWRPATVEQRIGRIDRVGQTRHVEVVVPYFKGGYEAAVVKIMQQSIGVLDRTVGGIDHALEYVAERLAALMLSGAESEAWQDLFRQTASLVEQARARIDADVDPILDHASFSAARAQAILDRVPADLESRTETFINRYASHSKLEVLSRGKNRVAVNGAPSAAGREDSETGFMGTFSRLDALDHEDVEFLSFGHPLVEQALEWAHSAHDVSAALALLRGCAQEGAAFIWHFTLDLPEDMPEASTYFEHGKLSFALDEAGRRRTELEDILHHETRSLDRMDASPLRGSMERWRMLVERNYASVEGLAQTAISDAIAAAQQRFDKVAAQRIRHLNRSIARRLSTLNKKTQAYGQAKQDSELAQHKMAAQTDKLAKAIADARPRLVAVVAVRMLRTRHVSV
jgi:ATP-dependent helicase HepA